MPFHVCSCFIIAAEPLNPRCDKIKRAQQAQFPLLIGFKNAPQAEIPITLDELYREYCRLTAWSYPLAEMPFVSSWMLLRASTPYLWMHWCESGMADPTTSFSSQ